MTPAQDWDDDYDEPDEGDWYEPSEPDEPDWGYHEWLAASEEHFDRVHADGSACGRYCEVPRQAVASRLRRHRYTDEPPF